MCKLAQIPRVLEKYTLSEFKHKKNCCTFYPNFWLSKVGSVHINLDYIVKLFVTRYFFNYMAKNGRKRSWKQNNVGKCIDVNSNIEIDKIVGNCNSAQLKFSHKIITVG